MKNATVIAVCRRWMHAVADRRTHIKRVKVKGHSEHAGNEVVDTRATSAQNGGAKGKQDIESIMGYIRENG